jgi:nucleotide-binding universal stress UspA family protein
VTIDRVVVGTDGSRHAECAVAEAAELAAATGAELVAVCAVGLLAGALAPGGHEAIRAELEHAWTEPVRRCAIPVRTEVRDGNPVQVLLDVADEVDANVIVVGSRGFGGFPNLLLGSTSTQLAQHSRRPVLIVPAPETDADVEASR